MRKLPRKSMRFLAAFLLAWCSGGLASMTMHESFETVLARTRTAIVADILQASERTEQFHQILTLQAKPVKTLLGESITAPKIDCTYSEGRPHQRGEMRVSPLVSGSGIEFGVAPGDRVILMLGSARADSNVCEILSIEVLQKEAQVLGSRP